MRHTYVGTLYNVHSYIEATQFASRRAGCTKFPGGWELKAVDRHLVRRLG